MRKSPPLTLDERYKLMDMFALGYAIKQVATRICRSVSTIYRELNRYGLDSKTKHMYASLYQQSLLDPSLKGFTCRKNRVSQKTWAEVEARLIKGIPPDSISGGMRKNEIDLYPDAPSCVAIYTHIDRRYERDGVSLYEPLMFKKSSAKRHRGSKASGPIKDGVSVSQRSKAGTAREELGHWEGDLMYIGSGYILLLVERLSGLKRMAYLPTKDSRACSRMICRILRRHRKEIKSITFDRGGEFARHEEIAKKLKCKTYFCHPHSPWEKGAVEQGNWMLRKFFPKGIYFKAPELKFLSIIENNLNNTPRKILSFDTAKLVYDTLLKDQIFASVA